MRLEKKLQRPASQRKLFLAFELDMDLKRKLHSNNRIFVKEARNFRFVDLEQLHMTIKFLGNNVSQNSLTQIIRSLEEILSDHHPLSLEIDSLRFGFPHQSIPKIVFYNINPTKELDDLYRKIGYKLKKLDLDDLLTTSFLKKDVYHLTIGRLKHQPNRAFARKIRDIINKFEFDTIEFSVKDFWLMESKLDKFQSPTYSYIHRFSLK